VSARPRIGVTSGDPAGIGPEIAAKAMAHPDILRDADVRLYGPPPEQTFTPGQLSAWAGRASYDAVVRATEDALDGTLDAIVTAPINKEAWALAGAPCLGHTELLTRLTRSPEVAMMFYAERLRVVLATVHIPLAEVPRALDRARVEEVVRLTAREAPRFGVASPRIALAGLNPHAGEGGLIGREDLEVLAPAVAACRADGVMVEGPLPADTVFVKAARGDYDFVVACYHDQGLIPVKLLAFGDAVNVTLGLPIIRTSVDHGTAFDIAGQGLADPSSMLAAMRLAIRLARVKRGN
jgi:4-hydroxythreonine-4-phosphate dehydrogenase